MRRNVLRKLLVLFGILCFMPHEASAIPAWSRKEGAPCFTCHYRFNRLNQTGLDYYRQGFRVQAQPSHSTQQLKPNLSDYFSVLGRVDISKRDDRDYTTDFRATLYGGGEVSSHWSFLGETTLNPPSHQEIADLFLGYSIGTKDQYLFMRAGQLLPFLTVDNPFEVAADRDPAFPRDRHVGASAGYYWNKLWGEIVVFQSASINDAPSRNKVDFVANGQYIFTSNGTSLGGYVWEGNVNVDALNTDPYKRYGFVGNFNEIAKGKLLLAAGFTTGKGDSGGGGSTKTQAFFGQGEYVFSERFSALLHVVRADPDTDVSDNSKTICTASAFWWPTDSVNVIGRFIGANQFGSTDKQWTLSLRFMY